MTQQANTRAIAEATGRDWAEWKFWLDEQQAFNLPHKDIAGIIEEEFGHVSGWWAQTITVAYEQAIGRREPGQREAGDFSVSVSRTLPFAMDPLLGHWQDYMSEYDTHREVAIEVGPSVSLTQKWRYWRCTLADGSKVTVNIQAKGDNRATLGIQHDRIASAEEAEAWRGYWKEQLAELAERV